MSTLREAISQVKSLDKLISANSSITDRAIVRELKNKARVFIKQQTDARKLWQSSNIFTNIPCLEMVEVPTSECCDYVSDTKIARSKYKLPKISEAKIGLLVQGVFSVDNNRKIQEITIARYINILKLGLKNVDIYYWVYNGYLYVSSPFVEVISIWAYFEEPIPDNVLYNNCKCPNQAVKNPCGNALDEEFKCPGFLEDAVIKDALKVLQETYFRNKVDQESNDKDDQVNKL